MGRRKRPFPADAGHENKARDHEQFAHTGRGRPGGTTGGPYDRGLPRGVRDSVSVLTPPACLAAACALARASVALTVVGIAPRRRRHARQRRTSSPFVPHWGLPDRAAPPSAGFTRLRKQPGNTLRSRLSPGSWELVAFFARDTVISPNCFRSGAGADALAIGDFKLVKWLLAYSNQSITFWVV